MRLRADDAALLIALLYKRAARSRIRLSESTVKRISGRKKLRVVFLNELKAAMDDLGYIFVDIDRGFAVMPFEALNGAAAATAKRLLQDVLQDMRAGKVDLDAVRVELGLSSGEGEEDDSDD